MIRVRPRYETLVHFPTKTPVGLARRVVIIKYINNEYTKLIISCCTAAKTRTGFKITPYSLKEWRVRRGLNPQSSVYEADELPLSLRTHTHSCPRLEHASELNLIPWRSVEGAAGVEPAIFGI
jgi:hypothetical protein